MQAYRIVEWRRRYEIKADKRDAGGDTPIEQLRRKPHEFIKWRVFGHKLGHKYRQIIQRAWRAGEINELAVIGFFGKLLEIAGDQAEPKYRGYILDEDQQPMDIRQIAELLGIHEVGRLSEAMTMLLEVDWVTRCEFPFPISQMSCENVENSALLQKLQGAAKIAGVNKGLQSLQNETVTEDKGNITETNCKTKRVSDISFVVSDSVDSANAKTRDRVVMQVCELLSIHPENKSDITTMQDIFGQIEVGIKQGELNVDIYERIIIEAKEAATHRLGKIGRFVNAMKREPFNYIPVQREVPGGKFSGRKAE